MAVSSTNGITFDNNACAAPQLTLWNDDIDYQFLEGLHINNDNPGITTTTICCFLISVRAIDSLQLTNSCKNCHYAWNEDIHQGHLGVRSSSSPSIPAPRLTFHRGAVLCIGGPALVMWVSPTEEEIFKVTLSPRAIQCI